MQVDVTNAPSPPPAQPLPGDVIATLREHLPEILRNRPVALAYIYGSAAIGYTTPLSDIDVALVISPDADLDAYQRVLLEMAIQGDIEHRCGIANVDVRSIDRAPLRVQGKVLTQGKLLYARSDVFRIDYETRTRKLYFDFRPVLDMMRSAYFSRLGTSLREKGLLHD